MFTWTPGPCETTGREPAVGAAGLDVVVVEARELPLHAVTPMHANAITIVRVQ
jgi:hypothetical protein